MNHIPFFRVRECHAGFGALLHQIDAGWLVVSVGRGQLIELQMLDGESQSEAEVRLGTVSMRDVLTTASGDIRS